VRAAIASGAIVACHDVSDGGLLVAVTEMAMEGGVGVSLVAAPDGLAAHGFWFGEDQGRYIAATHDAAGLLLAAGEHGVKMLRLGRAEGLDLTLPGVAPISLGTLTEAHRRFFPAWMNN
jgi:phosphoribosylformylglycinamidine (FGAM) synthase-like enzyme